MQAHTSLKLPLQLKPWEEYKRSIHQKLRYRGMACTDRQRDVLNCCWWKLRRQHRQLKQQVLVKDSFADVSQSVSRLPVQRGNLPVFTTSSHLYSFEKDMTLPASGHLVSIGWPSRYHPMSEFDDLACRNLSGDSCSVPITSVVYSAFVYNPYAPWWR